MDDVNLSVISKFLIAIVLLGFVAGCAAPPHNGQVFKSNEVEADTFSSLGMGR